MRESLRVCYDDPPSVAICTARVYICAEVFNINDEKGEAALHFYISRQLVFFLLPLSRVYIYNMMKSYI